MTNILIAFDEWEHHKITCEKCKAFDSREAGEGPCEVGRILFLDILQLLRNQVSKGDFNV